MELRELPWRSLTPMLQYFQPRLVVYFSIFFKDVVLFCISMVIFEPCLWEIYLAHLSLKINILGDVVVTLPLKNLILLCNLFIMLLILSGTVKYEKKIHYFESIFDFWNGWKIKAFVTCIFIHIFTFFIVNASLVHSFEWILKKPSLHTIDVDSFRDHFSFSCCTVVVFKIFPIANPWACCSSLAPFIMIVR